MYIEQEIQRFCINKSNDKLNYKNQLTMIRKYKVTISVIFGTLFLIFGFYAPTLSALLLTEKENQFTSINYILIGFGIMFLWGRITNIANVFVDFFKKKIK